MGPEEVLVELMYDDDYGFSAEVEVNGRQQILIQANLIEALRLLLDREYNVNPFAARLQLELDDEEGIYALAKFNNSDERERAVENNLSSSFSMCICRRIITPNFIHFSSTDIYHRIKLNCSFLTNKVNVLHGVR